MLALMVILYLFGSIHVMQIGTYQVVNGDSVETLNEALENDDDDAVDKNCDYWDQSRYKCLVNLKIKKLKIKTPKPADPIIEDEREELTGDDEIECPTSGRNNQKHPSHQFFERRLQLYKLPPRREGKKSLVPRDYQRTPSSGPTHHTISKEGEVEEDDKVIFKPKPPYKLKLRKEFQPS
ncbi:hypothetical protein R5R35_003691 [Gryllus longicercus]|uniref:Accessory gland protein n=1 Tax=Gryllus longicercus TaxID=2509291 RepID=A0AAN9V8Y4_9ORTH